MKPDVVSGIGMRPALPYVRITQVSGRRLVSLHVIRGGPGLMIRGLVSGF